MVLESAPEEEAGARSHDQQLRGDRQCGEVEVTQGGCPGKWKGWECGVRSRPRQGKEGWVWSLCWRLREPSPRVEEEAGGKLEIGNVEKKRR